LLETNTNTYRNKWYVLVAVSMGTFLATIDGSIVNVALPTLNQFFKTDFATVQWVVLGYLLTVTTLMLSIGRLGDMKGKKAIYTAGFVIFTLGSLSCALSPTIQILIAARIFQALGASMTMALGSAILTEAFPPNERGRVLGINGTIVSIGIVLGPTLGGLIINSLSWHWIFFVNLPVGILGILAVLKFVPNLKPVCDEQFDIAGASTLLVSVLSLLIGLTLGQQRGFESLPVMLLGASFIIFLTIFILIERKAKQPMIELDLFKNRLLSINLATGFMVFLCGSGTTLLMPFFLENLLHYEVLQVGLLLAVVPICTGIIAPIAGTLSDRFGTRPLTVIGLLFALIGYIAISTLSIQTTPLGYILRFIPYGIGVGIFQSPNNSAIMGTAPRERLGIVSGMLAMTRTLGQTAGNAVLGALWASWTFFHAGGVLPEGATAAPAAAQVAGLQNTFHVAIAIISIALILSIWALLEERVWKTSAQLNPMASSPSNLTEKGE
jgi:EmrB/QacA subfamily drug resistance transporter